ncbi:unnamed protein product [Ostreobium quekettii]|uniref:RNA polymerase III RPC4 n=1 Tax=Ostreobium quekettii TaxID=121088 RepID=A0A8S1IWB8_9CHLO|nr:unnamed protein product [Ostreobium quekettii]|eukprot:evm.model.scf_986.3 EVM.evm.TU.scf_986.3   scf_986:22702-24057(-)
MLGNGGSGGGGPGGRGPKKRKFVPKLRQRQKKVDDAAAAKAPQAPRMASETFSELRQQAEAEAKWERPGRRPHFGTDQRRNQSVAFGALLSGSAPAGKAGIRGHLTKPVVVVPEGGVAEKEGDKEELNTGPIGPVDELPQNCYYPTTLPLRPEGEEGERDGEAGNALLESALPCASGSSSQDLQDRRAGRELGLMRPGMDEERLLLMQLPSVFPAQATEVKVEGALGGAGRQGRGRGEGDQGVKVPSMLATKVEELPAGRIGKLLVFRSGRVKMVVGDVLMDVTCGTPWSYRQEVVAVNVEDEVGHCVFLGDIASRAICNPNVAQLLSPDPMSNFKVGKKVQWKDGIVLGEEGNEAQDEDHGGQQVLVAKGETKEMDLDLGKESGDAAADCTAAPGNTKDIGDGTDVGVGVVDVDGKMDVDCIDSKEDVDDELDAMVKQCRFETKVSGKQA